MLRALTTAGFALMLGACSASTGSGGLPQLRHAAPPGELTRPCAPPARLSGVLSAGAVERGWAQDRAALADCGARQAAVVRFYAERDAGLAGERPD